MSKLSFITLLALFVAFNVFSQSSPHGDKLTIKCDVCHNSKNWKTIVIKKDSFNHNKTLFPLVGQHQTVSCKKCHEDLIFTDAKTKTDCKSCHLDIHQNTLGTDCERCHTPITWKIENITQIHNQSRFPLHGRHAQLDCLQCHKSASLQRFDPMGTECVDCHNTDFYATTNPSHVASRFPKDCLLCHNENNWQSATFNHNNTAFPLTGAHIALDCLQCHATGYVGTPTSCVSCHITNYNATTNPNHIASKFSTDCTTCHNTSVWSPSTFSHNTSTSFPLTGAHIGVACISCHTNGYAGGTPTTCVGCHLANYNSATNPNHSTNNFSKDCQICHNNTAWQPSTFNHTTTSFPLTGAHTGVDCVSCHTNGYTGGTPTTCVGCHLSNFNSTTSPNHVQAKFSTDCLTCHNVTAWSPSTFNHSTATSFPLAGAHIGVSCSSCHVNGYAGIPTTCVSCHLTAYNATTNPNHISSKFSTDCITCHNVISWTSATFNHSTSTAFPLTGAHNGLACTICHPTNYNAIPTTCVSCHLTNYTATTNPSHSAAKFPTTCETCHTTTVWQPSTFNHATSTTFPLTGAHTGVTCISCHTNGFTGGTPTTCVGCHLTNFNATTNPNHVLAKFSTDCLTCHNVTAWSPSTFNHSTATTFPLAGAHIGVSCSSCHTAGYAGIPTTCVSCHLTNYNATTNPNHITAKFSTACITCHNVTAWSPSTFNHSTATTFPLTGSHTTLACVSCHPTGYTAIPTTCASCHLANYNSTTNPNHVTAKFATTCETCHTTTAWVPSTFNHSTATTFPLTGAHIGVTCIICHPTGYAAIPTTCVSCHLTTYNATTNPNHVTSKFPTTCETCHTTANWTSSTFNHSTSTSFPLTGAHIGLTCLQCHPTNYNAIPTTCVSCHLATYNATINPNHIGAKFATTCETCHTTTNWTSATFNHNAVATIPLTGNHNLACSICHTTPTNYTVYSCRQTGCHATAHNASEGSTGCYRCHPTGRAG